MNELGIKCGMCGQTSDFDLFCVSPLGLPLPKRTYQCPVCHSAFELKPVGKAMIYESGLQVPAPVAIVPIQGSL